MREEDNYNENECFGEEEKEKGRTDDDGRCLCDLAYFFVFLHDLFDSGLLCE